MLFASQGRLFFKSAQDLAWRIPLLSLPHLSSHVEKYILYSGVVILTTTVPLWDWLSQAPSPQVSVPPSHPLAFHYPNSRPAESLPRLSFSKPLPIWGCPHTVCLLSHHGKGGAWSQDSGALVWGPEGMQPHTTQGPGVLPASVSQTPWLSTPTNPGPSTGSQSFSIWPPFYRLCVFVTTPKPFLWLPCRI